MLEESVKRRRGYRTIERISTHSLCRLRTCHGPNRYFYSHEQPLPAKEGEGDIITDLSYHDHLCMTVEIVKEDYVSSSQTRYHERCSIICGSSQSSSARRTDYEICEFLCRDARRARKENRRDGTYTQLLVSM